MTQSFNIIVTSNSPSEGEPNRISDHTIKLSETVRLDGNWTVALQEIILTKSFFNIDQGGANLIVVSKNPQTLSKCLPYIVEDLGSITKNLIRTKRNRKLVLTKKTEEQSKAAQPGSSATDSSNQDNSGNRSTTQTDQEPPIKTQKTETWKETIGSLTPSSSSSSSRPSSTSSTAVSSQSSSSQPPSSLPIVPSLQQPSQSSQTHSSSSSSILPQSGDNKPKTRVETKEEIGDGYRVLVVRLVDETGNLLDFEGGSFSSVKDLAMALSTFYGFDRNLREPPGIQEKNGRLIITPNSIDQDGFTFPFFGFALRNACGIGEYSSEKMKNLFRGWITEKKPFLTEAVDLSCGRHNIMIYLESLIRPTLIGNKKANILRVIAIPDQPFGTNFTLTFDNLLKVPLILREFSTINIKLRYDTGEIVPFNFGRCVSYLHFEQNQ